jgi:prepilin-type N-terminal cleavage/methylation domain-containing protein
MEIKRKKNKGFTLVEILVSIGLLAIVATVGSNMFFTTFRSSAKTKALTTVKQNGDYALSIMERTIRGAEEVIENSDGDICEQSMNKVKLKNLDGSEIEFACLDEGTATGYIASDSSRLVSTEVKLDACSFGCSSEGEFYPQAVNIDFTLSQAADEVRLEERASAEFETTVTTRNF